MTENKESLVCELAYVIQIANGYTVIDTALPEAEDYIERVIAAHEASLWKSVSEPPQDEDKYYVTDKGYLYFVALSNTWHNQKGAVKKPTIYRELPAPPRAPWLS